MLRCAVVACVVAVASWGCGDDGATLVVELKTDLAPVTEFDLVRVDLVRGTRPVGIDSTRASAGDTYLDGVRVAELTGLERGAHTLVVRLEREGASLIARELSLEITSDTTVVVVVVGRACRHVMCPGPGDPPTNTSCLAGHCVDPRCAVLGESEMCGDGECTVDADCPPVAECAAARCVDGACLAVLEGTRCRAGESCDPVRGCVAAGDPDAGTVDAGRDAGSDAGPPPTCEPGRGDCNGDGTGRDADGCETDTEADVARCGNCETSCSFPNAMPACVSGICRISACNPGFDDCDGLRGNGCEAPLSTLAHCGACGTACARPQATATCSTGTCRIATCSAGFDDCNRIDADGCETALRSDPSHCGACGRACGPNSTCADGMCRCVPGFLDCSAASGCETVVSPVNCTACGNACGAGETCGLAGCQCGSTVAPAGEACVGAQACCMGLCANLGSDENNCGACGSVCGPAEACMGGDCCCGTACRMTGEACTGSAPDCLAGMCR